MLRALEHPVAFLVLLLSLLVGLTARGAFEALLASWLGDRRPVQEGRVSADPRRQVDPFGAVAALIGGLGWSQPVELFRPRRRATLLAVNLGGPLLNVLVGVALLLTWRVTDGPGAALTDGAAVFLQQGASLAGVGDVLLLVGASQLYLGVLALVPLPPLEGGRLLFGLAPRTHGWLRAEHQLVERNIGVAILLALLLIPLGGGTFPLLLSLLDTVLAPVLGALCGA